MLCKAKQVNFVRATVQFQGSLFTAYVMSGRPATSGTFEDRPNLSP